MYQQEVIHHCTHIHLAASTKHIKKYKDGYDFLITTRVAGFKEDFMFSIDHSDNPDHANAKITSLLRGATPFTFTTLVTTAVKNHSDLMTKAIAPLTCLAAFTHQTVLVPVTLGALFCCCVSFFPKYANGKEEIIRTKAMHHQEQIPGYIYFPKADFFDHGTKRPRNIAEKEERIQNARVPFLQRYCCSHPSIAIPLEPKNQIHYAITKQPSTLSLDKKSQLYDQVVFEKGKVSSPLFK